MPKVPTVSLHLYGISPEKHQYEIDFLPTVKQSFLQLDSISLGVHSQA